MHLTFCLFMLKLSGLLNDTKANQSCAGYIRSTAPEIKAANNQGYSLAAICRSLNSSGIITCSVDYFRRVYGQAVKEGLAEADVSASDHSPLTLPLQEKQDTPPGQQNQPDNTNSITSIYDRTAARAKAKATFNQYK